MSTDELIAEVVAASVLSNPHIRGGHLTIQVQNRVVILSGDVPSTEARKMIRQLAWSTPGVHDVCSDLGVVPPGEVTGGE
ncbi:BON domain-containing protein [Actinoplanes sp. NBC_00393]|uniref:BON domain-containing protein n=1 Tax=Actinoplanes sp. NBC_00393 TaxID=2975953 RepID=UPI002E1FEAEF